MTQPRNLAEFTKTYSGTPMQLYRTIARVTGRSVNTAIRYCIGDTKTDDPAVLAALSKLTGISAENIFKNFTSND